jgi:hypothetical protein
MKAILIALLLLTAFVGRAGTARAATSATACMPSSSYANNFRAYVIQLTASSDSVEQATRTSAQLPAVADTAQIAFVNDSTVCSQAAEAHAVAANQSGDPLPVYVLRVSATRYVVFNATSVGEYMVYYIFDENFNLLSSLAS